MAHAQELAHLNSIAWARHFSSWLHQLFHDAPAALQQSEAQISFCKVHGLLFWLAPAHVLHGWAVAVSGEPEAGILELTRGIAAYRATGAELLVPFHLGLHAATLRETGRPIEPALTLLSDALARTERTGERSFEAEHHRVRGECLLSLPTPDHAEAEASFVRALEVARRQSAKLWELRAATSLARLWQGQGKVAEARDLLVPIYGWFTEGFDTVDLRDAAKVLDTLGRSVAQPRAQLGTAPAEPPGNPKDQV
jgi:predicted ATPase